MNHRAIQDCLRRLFPLTLSGFLLSCGPAAPGSSSHSVPSPPALEVEYAGCGAVLVPGPICVVSPKRQLRLWVGAPPEARIELQVDGRRLNAAAEEVQEGQRYSLTILPGAEEVEVLVEAQEGRASWSLSLAETEGEAPRNVLREVSEQATLLLAEIQAGRFAAVRETLDDLRLPEKAPAESRCLVSYSRSLLAASEGDYRTALAEVQKAVEIAERVKMGRYLWVAEQELAELLREVGRSRESAQIFERLLLKPRSADSCEYAELLNNQAWSVLLAREAGEVLRDPTPLLEKALATYATCKRATPENQVNVLLNLALAHLQEGRLAKARTVLAQAHENESHPPLSHRLWWLDLEARIAFQDGRPAEALSLFNGLDDLASEASSPDGRLRAAIGQARSQRVLGDEAAALETLRKAEALLDEQSLQIPVHEGRETFVATRPAIVSLHIESLLGQGRNEEALDVARHARSRVLRQLERVDRLASLTPDRRVRWSRIVMSYQERRASLEDRAKDDWTLPADQLRQEQAARREEAESLKKLLDQAFVILGDPEKQARDELPPPRPGELILAYHSLSQGWVGFAADGKTVKVHRFELTPDILSRPEDLARRLLFPFRTSIGKAKRIRILPCGPLRGVDFHALPFDGDILLAKSPVVYGLDLPASTALAQRPGRRALLVANSRGDLPGTLDETRRVGRILESGSEPWTIEELKNTEASAEAVRGRLATTDLLHYAGHGIFSGLGGWESSLLLAGDSQLILGDFLALDRVPAWVVLSACDTGRSSTETPVESLGLAHAFLLAGSRAVVASTRPAVDRTVPAFFAELYRQWDLEPDLAVALQRAQLSWRKQNPRADWLGFRLFEP